MSDQSTQAHKPIAPMSPPTLEIGVIGWLRHNLFNSWLNSLLTVVAVYIIATTLFSIIQWGIIDAAFGTTPESCKTVDGACWSFIYDMWALFIVGTYPFELRWRPFLAFIIIILLGLMTLYRPLRHWNGIYVIWIVAGLVCMVLIQGWPLFEKVETTMWGGLLLTIILSVAGILLSFPIGVLLALGRRSRTMPIIRALCVGYIELIRGVPLITVLFMSSVMLPLFFPSGFDLDKVLRAQIGIILFSAAYVAEVVRGGLQALPKGQEEAAMAVGLKYWQMMVFIILPQALRIVIPPLVSTFISLLKDTSLVSIIGLFDMLGIVAFTTANPQWLGKIVEAYVFIGAIYWVICFSMSRYSLNLEKRFKTGQH